MVVVEEKLRTLGLNGYEAKVYHALLSSGTSTAHQAAKASGVPSGKIYPTLNALEKKGFVNVQRGRPQRFSPVALEIALSSVLQQQKNRLATLEKQGKEIISSFQRLTALRSLQAAQASSSSSHHPEDIVEVYRRQRASFARSIVLHDQAKKYWKTLSRLTLNKEHLDAYRRAVKRGVTARAITSLAESSEERIKQWQKQGVEVRLLDELPFRVSIYDDRGVIFRFFHGKEYVCVHIVNERLAQGLNMLFEELWRKAKLPIAAYKN